MGKVLTPRDELKAEGCADGSDLRAQPAQPQEPKHLRLSDRTRGLVGSRELGLMKPTAYLVNTSRGPIVDEVALVDTLHRGAIAGAGLDVFDQEPLPSGHPFTQLENTVLTPHLGYVTREGYRVFYEQTVEDIAAYLRGEQVRVLNPEAAKHSRNRLS